MRSLSLIAIVIVASLSSTLFAQDCSNPLLALYNLPALDQPLAGGDLPYCTNLQNAETCCSADTVATFQDRANGLIDRLNTYFAAKDLYLAQLRNSYLDRFNDLLGDISDDHSDNLQTIRTDDATIADELQANINSSRQIRTEARDINNQFVAALRDYQTNRTNCFNTALQVHASSWCLACDPNYATQGVTNEGTVTFSDDLCQTISDACWPFFNEGARFNPLIRAREAYWGLVATAGYLNNFSSTNQVTPFNISEDPYNPLPSQQAVEVPDEWIAGAEETASLGQCTDLWSGDEYLARLLTIGAPNSEATNDNSDDEVSAVDEEDSVVVVDNTSPETQVSVVDDTPSDTEVTVIDGDDNARLLQDILAGDEGVWNPDFTATGLNFDNLRTDPADYFGASDFSDSLNPTEQNQDVTDQTDDDNNLDSIVIVNPSN